MRPGKRAFDLFWSLLGVVVLAPFFVAIALLIKLQDGGPVFFRQERVGYKGNSFYIWKFRTMVVDAEEKGKQLTIGRDPRITRVGHWLRRFKLDELPQLFNVIRGEMSLVGPRPEVPRYVDLYTAEQRKVLDLVPGITDPASVLYSDESDILAQAQDPEATYVQLVMPDKIRLNLDYARTATVWNDFKMIVDTIIKLLPFNRESTVTSPVQQKDRTLQG